MNNPIMFLKRDNKTELVPASFFYFLELLLKKNKFLFLSKQNQSIGIAANGFFAAFLSKIFFIHQPEIIYDRIIRSFTICLSYPK